MPRDDTRPNQNFSRETRDSDSRGKKLRLWPAASQCKLVSGCGDGDFGAKGVAGAGNGATGVLSGANWTVRMAYRPRRVLRFPPPRRLSLLHPSRCPAISLVRSPTR